MTAFIEVVRGVNPHLLVQPIKNSWINLSSTFQDKRHFWFVNEVEIRVEPNPIMRHYARLESYMYVKEFHPGILWDSSDSAVHQLDDLEKLKKTILNFLTQYGRCKLIAPKTRELPSSCTFPQATKLTQA